MAKYTGPVCRLCRREGTKLYLKGDRCYTAKCAFERRAYAPGQHGKGRIKVSDYGLQLRAKQKARRIYGVLEKQFRAYYEEAAKVRGVTGEVLIQILESRLDNMVFRAGFAASRSQARQLVRHGHFTVNGKKVNIPSYRMKAEDVIDVREKSRSSVIMKDIAEALQDRTIPEWLDVDKAQLACKVVRLPERAEINIPVEEHLIVERYSR
ncbi:30S ribosomal protein S4 [Clostridium sp. 'deep sea']|uniref:30S ribosomal protein S4 n=1 Tax=Clostridium sp. 'deep sea' TaxID=2779445 RepID=UPI0018965095|nr:30S ribosomal protein S4 [Clostridium sp. 'deep sea']QOR34603.1 30S ribosomal protein S4 [Clostridium sp. 'deep sea']